MDILELIDAAIEWPEGSFVADALPDAKTEIIALRSKLEECRQERTEMNFGLTEHIKRLGDERAAIQSRLDAEMKRTAEAMQLVHDRTARGDSWMEMCDELTERLKAVDSRLGAYQKLEAACREWKPIYESLGNDEPDDPITWALKELDSLSAGGTANTDPVAGRVITERPTSDPSAGVDGADRESPQQSALLVENQMPFITREDIEKAALEPLPYDGRGMVVVERLTPSKEQSAAFLEKALGGENAAFRKLDE